VVSVGTVKLLALFGRAGPIIGRMPRSAPCYTGYRFPPAIISHAICLYFRFPLSLRMVEEMLAARGIVVSHETVHRRPLPSRPRQSLRRLGRGHRRWRCRLTAASISPPDFLSPATIKLTVLPVPPPLV
jgi:hypothetical protein